MSLTAEAILQKGAYALSVAALLAAGGTIVDNKMMNERQEQKLEDVAELKQDLREITKDLSETTRQLAVVADRLERSAP